MKAEERNALDRQVHRANELEYLACRRGADGHHWQRCKPDFTPTVGIATVKQCLRCKTIRREIHGTYGEMLAADYEYPVGYLYHRNPDDPRGEPLLPPRAVRKSYDELISANENHLPKVTPLGESEGMSFSKYFTK